MPRILDLGVGLFELDIRWNDAFLERKNSFDYYSNSSCTLEVSDVALEGADVEWLIRRPVRREDLGYRIGLNGIAYLRTCSVRLKNPGHIWIKPSYFADVVDKSSLASFGWLCDARRLAVLVRGGNSDDSASHVAITDCIRDALQHHVPNPSPRVYPLALWSKLYDFQSGPRTPAASSFRVISGDSIRLQPPTMACSGQRRFLWVSGHNATHHTNFSKLQAHTRLVCCNQTAGAGGIDGDTWTTEVEEPRHPVAEHARDRAGSGVLGRKIRVFHYYIIIIIGKATDVDAGLGSRGLRDRNAS